MIKIESLFENKERIVIDDDKLEHFLNGVKLKYNLKNEIYRIYNKNEDFIGTGEVKDKRLKRDVII